MPAEVSFTVHSFFIVQGFTMHSIISIVGIVLNSKENYPEWSRKIQHTLIFNELWKGVCVGDGDKEPEQPTSENNSPFGKIRTTKPMH